MIAEKKSEAEFLKMILNIQKEGCFGNHLDELISERIKLVSDENIVDARPAIIKPVFEEPEIPTITVAEKKTENTVMQKPEPIIIKEVVKKKATKK
jgi:hypothetical protein